MAIIDTTIKNEVQSRITALTGVVAPKDIFKVAVESSLMDVDKTNLISVLNAAILLIDGSMSTSDVVALNAARVAIDKTILGVPLGSLRPFVSQEPSITLSDGTVWLQTGQYETDTFLYPNLPAVILAVTYTGVNHAVTQTLSGACYNPNDGLFYATVEGWLNIHKYDSGFNFIGTVGDTVSYANPISDITHDGNNFWILSDQTGSEGVVKVDASFNKIKSITIATSSPDGLTYGAGHLWVSDNDVIFKVNPTTDAVVNFKTLVGVGAIKSLDFDGTNFWVCNNDGIFQYDVNWNATGVSSVTEDSLPKTAVYDGTNMWVMGTSTFKVYKYDVTKGVGTPTGTSPLGGTVYMRVK